MNNVFKKILIPACLVALLFLIGGFRGSEAARASISDFFKSLISPGGTPSETEEAQSPYKPVLEYEKAVIEAVKKASPAVVSIIISKNVPIIEQCPYSPFSDLPRGFEEFFGGSFSVPCERGSALQEVGGGSGFIVGRNGLIVTNKHVVSDRDAAYTVFTNDGKKYPAKVLARDPAQDIAILKIEGGNFPVVILGNSDELELGQTAIAIGNALAEFRNTVSVGVISGLSRNVTASGVGVRETIQDVIQTDAAINPGNSGGPLLNLQGQVVAINTAVALGAQNIGFAIPINRAKRDIQSVEATGEIQAPYLGVRYVIIAPEVARKEKLPVEYGALVRGGPDGPAVISGSPAAQAGITAEDIILEVGGKKIDEDHPLGSVIADFKVGEKVTLLIRRGEKEIRLQITLGKRPE